MGPSRRFLLGAIAATVVGATAVVVVAVRKENTTVPRVSAQAPSATPSPTPFPADQSTPGAVTTKRTAAILSSPTTDASVVSRLRPGVLLPVGAQREGYFSVLTPCEIHGWVAAADVEVHPRTAGVPRSLREATIVVDPGHGGVLTGAVGPSGLPEKEPNADIARRLEAKLEGSRVFVTMSGDFNAGLEYRAAIADALRSHVFISIHNNAEPDVTSDRPGTETYYQYRSVASKRLAGLLYEEVVRAVEPFDADWVADRDAGAKYRLNDQGIDYYGLLRRAEVTTVLVEGLFVSNASEEALLRRPEVREAIAAGLATGLRRFFETDDPGTGYVEPYPREPGPSGRLPTRCTDPAA